ncbi:MAG: DUF3881 family protein [Lachnospiraceae bacterium]|nr:DUF3881 family protein [Lachnospiraceae bacterium]
MHSFLRSIGFKDINQRQFDDFYQSTKKNPDNIISMIDPEGYQFCEYQKEVVPGIGIAFRGIIDEDGQFIKEYYFPYRKAMQISTKEDVELVKESDKESYMGVCDDIRLGVDLVFHIQDMIELLKYEDPKTKYINKGGVVLSALALDGMVLLPVVSKKPEMVIQRKKHRRKLISDAREGNQKAFEELSLNDIDIYSKISKRIDHEDVYSIVLTSFMPSGIENDKYQIIGDIVEVEEIINTYTMQKMYVLTVSCNDMLFDVCINEVDLLGEPKKGRRFKGKIWMQGRVTGR